MAKIKKNYLIEEDAVAVVNEVARLLYMKPGDVISIIARTYAPVFCANMRKIQLESDVDLYNLFQLAGLNPDPKDFGLYINGEEEAVDGAE